MACMCTGLAASHVNVGTGCFTLSCAAALCAMGNTKTAIASSDNTTTGHNEMYTSQNFKTKKQLKDAVVAGRKVTVWQPGPFGGNVPENGTVCLEGPHYPEPHKWYARATLENGYIVKVQ